MIKTPAELALMQAAADVTSPPSARRRTRFARASAEPSTLSFSDPYEPRRHERGDPRPFGEARYPMAPASRSN